MGSTQRESLVSVRARSKSTIRYPSALGSKLVLRARSDSIRWQSSSVSAQPPSKGDVSARRVPFSAMRSWPAKTMSWVLSPWPAEAYR